MLQFIRYLLISLRTFIRRTSKMPITNFEIKNEKVIKFAKCENVPKIMIIAGPNGVGKSTLLYKIKKNTTTTKPEIFYILPHRGHRRTKVLAQALLASEKRYGNFVKDLTLPHNVGGPSGVVVQNINRRQDSIDEAQAFIKFTIAQIEIKCAHKQHQYIRKSDFNYPIGKAPDVFVPIKEMTKSLLPHLSFKEVSIEDRTNVKILFSTIFTNEIVDIDNLSSGEKEVISIFLPLLEYEMENILKNSFEGNESSSHNEDDITMLIDEPDLHIHPSLQMKMLEYMRKKANEDNIQFIIATHSPVFINNATNDELYALVPPSGENENQLRQVISDEERHNLFKEIYGDLTLLTLGKPVILLEGRALESSKISDQKILETLNDLAKDFIFIPIGGKSEVKGGIAGLSKILEEQPAGYQIFAIVDRDYDIGEDEEERIFRWPFNTIENALLNTEAIANVLKPLTNIEFEELHDEIIKALDEIFKEMIPTEIGARIGKVLKPITMSFNKCSRQEEVENKVEEFQKAVEDIKSKITSIKNYVLPIENEVNLIISEGKANIEFKGKTIIHEFWENFVKKEKRIYIGYEEFCNLIASEIRKMDKCPQAITDLLSEIKSKLS